MSAWSDAVLAKSPFWYYRLNEASGAVAVDSSGAARDGVLTSVAYGAASLVPADPSDAAITCATSSAEISTNVAAPFYGLGITHLLGIKTTGGGAGSRRLFYAFGGNGTTYLTLGTTSSFTDSSTTYDLGYDATPLFDNAPHLLELLVRASSASVGQPATVELWVDGQMVGTASIAGFSSTQAGQTSIRLNRSAATNRLDGTFDEWALFARALSLSDLADLWDAWTGAAAATPDAEWWDGAALHPAQLDGWHDGTAVQPVTPLGWWDGAAIQPLK